LVTLLLYAALAFQDPSGECYVRGYLYQDQDKSFTLTRNSDDTCWVKHATGDNSLVMFHKTRWVMVKIPDLKGHTNFWYKWGSDKAYINGQAVNIEWGFSVNG